MSLDEIRKKKLEEMMNMQGVNEEQQLQQQIQEIESVVKTKLTKDALERYGNIRTAYPEKAVQLIVLLGEFLQSGKVDIIDDNMLKEIIMRITPKKKDFKIRRR